MLRVRNLIEQQANFPFVEHPLAPSSDLILFAVVTFTHPSLRIPHPPCGGQCTLPSAFFHQTKYRLHLWGWIVKVVILDMVEAGEAQIVIANLGQPFLLLCHPPSS